MATLIGDGGHARDIWSELNHDRGWKMVAHHEHYEFDPETIIGINSPQLRATVAEKLGIEDLAWEHPHAFIGNESGWLYGTHINYGVTMTRTTLGHHCTIAPGVTICGDVQIGDRVFIGAGSTIKNLVTIGDDAFIPMGSVVVRDVASGERYHR